MLTNSFIHIQGIGNLTEQRLWDSGIRDWDSISGEIPVPISAGRKRYLVNTINLENLMVTAYNMKLKDTPFNEELLIDESPAPANTYGVDLGVVDKIKGGAQIWESGRCY